MFVKFTLDRDEKLKVAILVDIDGTLAGLYEKGVRELRSTAIPALKLLSDHAPVFLWSAAGNVNGEGLLQEYPELRKFISGCYSKDDFPVDLVERPYCIDDDVNHENIYGCRHVILEGSYNGGKDSGDLMEAAKVIVADIKRRLIGAQMDNAESK